MTAVGVAGILVLLLMLFSGTPVGFVMGIVGVAGFGYVVNPNAALSMLSRDIWDVFSSYNMTVVPLFVFMGQLAFYSGVSKRLYDAAHVMVGRRRGGLAMATVAACALFGAICGSSNATAATMASVALPEMRRFGYGRSLATATVASAGSLGILIPPSVVFIIYGILTEQSIGRLSAAGILPGIALSVLMVAGIYVQLRLRPDLAPLGGQDSEQPKLRALLGMGEAAILFLCVIGGMFVGLFTATEAAAVGAFLTLLFGILRKQLSWGGFRQALTDTVRISCMIMVIVGGAVVFGKFMAITQIPFALADWVGHLPIHRHAIMLIILFFYLVGGCFMDALAMIMLTVPIFFPVVTTLGFDPIWFGVIIVLIGEMGVITPPVGINVYVVGGIVKDVPLGEIFRGVTPFLIAMILCSLLLLFVPAVATFLPDLLFGGG